MRQSLLAKGRAVYEFNCYFCHGYRGDARTVAAKNLSPPPLNFWRAADLTPARVEKAVRFGRPGTAMQSFTSRLTDEEIKGVAIYVASGLSGGAAYHTESNGWPDHERRYGAAYPFVLGEIPLDIEEKTLSERLRSGLKLFRSICSTCHNGDALKSNEGFFRSAQANAESNETKEQAPRVRKGDCSRCHDGVDSSGNPLPGYHSNLSYGEHAGRYAEEHEGVEEEYGEYGQDPHDVAPKIARLTEEETRGRDLYQSACAFCHAADGTGRNWIGDFLAASPPDFTDKKFAESYDRDRFVDSVLEAPAKTSMPSFEGVLAREEIEAVAHYVERAFIEKKAD
ncbi:MAG: c-type cytochrome [Parvularculaceae bacterium]